MRCSVTVPWGVEVMDGWTGWRMKGKGGVRAEGVLEEKEKIKMKAK